VATRPQRDGYKPDGSITTTTATTVATITGDNAIAEIDIHTVVNYRQLRLFADGFVTSESIWEEAALRRIALTRVTLADVAEELADTLALIITRRHIIIATIIGTSSIDGGVNSNPSRLCAEVERADEGKRLNSGSR
jgi:hypothetical protein